MAEMQGAYGGYPSDGAPASPTMTAHHLQLRPFRSPSPDIAVGRMNYTCCGDTTLISHLGDGRNLDIARTAGCQSLPYDGHSPDEERRRGTPTDRNLMSRPSLQHLAAEALQAASLATAPPSLAASVPKMIPNISIPTGQLSIHDELPTVSVSAPRYISGNRVASPRIAPSSGPLPPLQHGVCAPAGEIKDTATSQSLPSLRSTFGDFRELAPERLSEPDLGRVSSGPSSTFPTSPVGNLGHRFSLTTNLPSSPRSPLEGYRTLSPDSATSGIHCYTTNDDHPRAPTEHSSSNAGETLNTVHSGSTPATSSSINSTSITDQMSIDGITRPQPVSGSYTCTVPGCNAAAFQTQYLLNSHMNVHSSIRPHYCPVKGCPRSEGGKGFKRKNELIRHGLVHDSPGYVCPFCPDREHKYPRPDNLQRHVRVHHVDKDKDDPQLRDVIAQRPDGPNRGRRQRRPPS